MQIDARREDEVHRYFARNIVVLVDRETGMSNPYAYYADTEGGWYEEYIVDPERPDRFLTVPVADGQTWPREIAIRRCSHRPFDLVNKFTGEVIAESQ